ncbi:MAG: FecR family protein [Methylacidiphilales bacterium]|nr:FecR family protein [Candidatus Methylacidiphilales bacterium]
MKFKVISVVLQLVGVSLLWSLPVGVLHADSVDATASKVKGEPSYVSPGGGGAKITPGSSIPVGSTIKTGSSGATGIQLVPGATTVPEANTNVTIKSLTYSKAADGTVTRHIALDLTKGSIFNSLAKKDGHSTFLVYTPMGVAAARGTDWSITVTGTGVTIQVLDGSIVFTLPNGTQITIPAGASYDASTNTISNLTDEEKQEIINAIEQDGGFTLAGGNPENGPVEYTNGSTINPSNISILPENSQSR